jgi:hypothetical protein
VTEPHVPTNVDATHLDPGPWLRDVLTAVEAGARQVLASVAAARGKGLRSTVWDDEETSAEYQLCDVEAKRRILDWLDRLDAYRDEVEQYGGPDTDEVRNLLASAYSRWPGWREDWQPTTGAAAQAFVRNRLVTTADGKVRHEEIQPAGVQVWPPYVEVVRGVVYVRGHPQHWHGPWRHETYDHAAREWRTVAEGSSVEPCLFCPAPGQYEPGACTCLEPCGLPWCWWGENSSDRDRAAAALDRARSAFGRLGAAAPGGGDQRGADGDE